MHVLKYFFIDVILWQYPLFYDELFGFIFTFVDWTKINFFLGMPC